MNDMKEITFTKDIPIKNTLLPISKSTEELILGSQSRWFFIYMVDICIGILLSLTTTQQVDGSSDEEKLELCVDMMQRLVAKIKAKFVDTFQCIE